MDQRRADVRSGSIGTIAMMMMHPISDLLIV